jgi:uncharacterized membrane protein YgcG
MDQGKDHAMWRRAAIVAWLCVAAAAPAAAQERILLFVSDVQVQPNGDLIVVETIRVQAEGREIRRGILRDFPTRYRRPDGYRAVVGFEVASVTRDGAPETYITEPLSNGMRVRIGRADRLLPRGQHTYVITYRTTRQLGFFAHYDELYWNVTGTGWTFAIDVAEARITLPQSVPFRQTAFYTGPQDSRGQDARIVEQQPGRIVFRTTRPLPPRNGLTVAVAWQKGIIAPPTVADLARWWLTDNLPLVLGGCGFLLLLGYYVAAWNLVGRDPPRGTIIPLFAPPNGMSAAAARYVHRMGFDDRCFTAAIVDLGVNGHLRLKGSGDNMVIERRAGGREIGAPERAAHDQLFARRPSLELDQANHEILRAAKAALRDGLAHAYSGMLFNTNNVWSVIGAVGAILFALAVAITILLTYGEQEGVPIIIAIVIGMVSMAIAAGAIAAWLSGSAIRLSIIIAVVVVIGLDAVAVLILMGTVAHWVDMLAVVPPVLAAGLAAFAFYLLKAPTRQGRRVMDAIEGFRQYLGVAEEERLQFLHPPEKTPQLFEKFLPHAIALDVENAWAQRFAGVLAAAGAAAHEASTWYSVTSSTNDPVSLASRLGGEFSNAVASASTAPGSSAGGSSGGGSSGGGGGGGGGSGW